MVNAVGFIMLLISSYGRNLERMERKMRPIALVWLKHGNLKRGDRQITPERGRSVFYCRSARIRRLPKP